MSTDTKGSGTKRRLRPRPTNKHLHIVVKPAVYEAILLAAAFKGDSVSGFLAHAASTTASKVLAERGICPECKQPVAEHKTAAA